MGGNKNQLINEIHGSKQNDSVINVRVSKRQIVYLNIFFYKNSQ